LENVVERIVVLCKKDTIDADIVSEVMGRSSDYSSERQFDAHTEVELNDGLLKNVEAETIRKVLEETNGNKTQAAEKLGISVTTLWRRLKKLE